MRVCLCNWYRFTLRDVWLDCSYPWFCSASALHAGARPGRLPPCGLRGRVHAHTLTQPLPAVATHSHNDRHPSRPRRQPRTHAARPTASRHQHCHRGTRITTHALLAHTATFAACATIPPNGLNQPRNANRFPHPGQGPQRACKCKRKCTQLWSWASRVTTAPFGCGLRTV